MKHNLTLVQLSAEQIILAKEVNGPRKQVTHGLICGPHGQIFGTEKQCRKYYSVWVKIFPQLFDKGVETNQFEIMDYKDTFNLVNILLELHGPLESASRPSINSQCSISTKKPPVGIFSRLWTKVTGL